MEIMLAEQLATHLDEAFETLVREHQDRLYALSMRFVGNAADAEDITQESFVRAYRALCGYESSRIRELNLRPWLTTIALNACRTHLARHSRRRATTTVDDGRADDRLGGVHPAPDSQVERRESDERWAGLVRRLPPVYRAAVLLRHLDGMSYPEMAAVLGRPEGTVKAQVHRGVGLLRAAFEADERLHPNESHLPLPPDGPGRPSRILDESTEAAS